MQLIVDSIPVSVLTLSGCPRTKRDIVRTVHVGIMTVARRLDEFAATKSGTMKPQEFEATVAQMDQEERRMLETMQPETPGEQNDDHCCLHIRTCLVLFQS